MIASSSSSAATTATMTTTMTTTTRRLTKSPPPSPPSPPRTRKLSKKRRILEFTYLSDHDIQSARSSIARSRTLSSISGISDRLSFKRGSKKTNVKLSLDETRGGDEEYQFVQPESAENWLPPLKLGSPAFESNLSPQVSPTLMKSNKDIDWDPDLHLHNFALFAFGHHDGGDAGDDQNIGIANGDSHGLGSYETEGQRISLSMSDVDPMAPGRPSTTSSRAKFIIGDGDGDGVDHEEEDREHDGESPISVTMSLRCISSPSSPALPSVPPYPAQSQLPPQSPTQTTRPMLTRRYAFDTNAHWTLRMALIDERLSDEVLVRVLERCVGGGTKTTGKDDYDYRTRPLPPIPTSATSQPHSHPNHHLLYHLNPHYSHPHHHHPHHHPHPHLHPQNSLHAKTQINPQNPTFRHILLTVRELIRTEKNYLDSLKMLLVGYSGPQEYQSQPNQHLQVRTHAPNASNAVNSRYRYSSYTQPNSPTNPTSHTRPMSTIAANARGANGDESSASPRSLEWTTEDVEVDDVSSNSHTHSQSHTHSYYSHPHYSHPHPHYPHPSFPSSHHYPHPHPAGHHPHPHSSRLPPNAQSNSKPTPPPLMRAYISELVQVSEAFVAKMERDLCVGGVARAFVGMCGNGNSVPGGMSANGVPTEMSEFDGLEGGGIKEEEEEDMDGMEGSLERAYVAWCGVVGTWFVDDESSESGHGRHSGKRESKRERERKISHSRGREETGKGVEDGGMINGEVKKKSGRRKLSKARHSKAVGGIISLNASSSSNYTSDPSTSTSIYASPSTSTPNSASTSTNSATANANINSPSNLAPDEADEGRRITSKSRTTSTTSLKRKMSQWRKSLPSVPGYFGIGSSSGGSTSGDGRDLRGMRGGTVSMYEGGKSFVPPPLPLPLPPSVTRNGGGGATPRARQQTLPPGLTMTMTVPTTAISTATATATANVTASTMASTVNGILLFDGGERRAFDLGRNGISDGEEEEREAMVASGSGGGQARGTLLARGDVVGAVAGGGGSQTRKKSTKSIKSTKSTKSSRLPTPPTAFSMRGIHDFGVVGDYGITVGAHPMSTLSGNGFGGGMPYLVAGIGSMNGHGVDEGSRGMQTRSKSAVSVGMGSMVGRSLSFVGIGSRKKNSDGEGGHRRGESIDFVTAGGTGRRNGIDFGGGGGGWVVDDRRRNGVDGGNLSSAGVGGGAHGYASVFVPEHGGALSGRSHGEYVGDGDKTPRKLPTVRDLAILPTQRVMRYVLLFRDLLAHIPATSPSRTIVEKAVDAAVRVAEKCDRAQGNAAFLRAG